MAPKHRGLLRRPASITGRKAPKSFKPQQARQLIRRFHVLSKNKHAVLRRLSTLAKSEYTEDNYKVRLRDNTHYKEGFTTKDESAIDTLDQHQLIRRLGAIDGEIERRGGLDAYQIASTQGQNEKRGGDSSKKLVEWLNSRGFDKSAGLRALEIGCLSPNNVISTCGIFSLVERIDLNSQSPLIKQQDFMERLLPHSNSEKFHLVLCSLVVNFVPSAEGRGAMLRRITQFLLPPQNGSVSSLFLVLPLPCVSNSRYFDNERLKQLMASLGFTQVFHYEAKKVAYWLYDWDPSHVNPARFRKQELHSGATRNNFCIVLD